MSSTNTSLSAEHHFLVRLMRNLVVPTFVLDNKGKVLIWNLACERLTNYKADDLIGTNDHWKAFYDEPRDCLADLLIKNKVGEIQSLYSATTDSEDDQFGVSVENWCEIPNIEGHCYLAIDAAAIYNDSGKIIAVVETIRDMTEQKLAHDKLERLAQHDGLTGLANRRAFDSHLKSHWSLAQREQTPIALLFIDIDYFKQFNDIYGHQAGDECLQAVAKTIANQQFRPSDFTARYGGEEFTVILPQSDIAGAMIVAERIREEIYNLNWEHSGSSNVNRVTVSIGCASLVPNRKQHYDDLIKIADDALYQAKDSGRNRVITGTS